MKKLLLSLILMVFAAQLSAQSLTFKYEGETIQPGTTIDIVSEISESLQIICDLEITNTTDNDINVVVNIVDSETGSNDFCWGNCYMPGVYEASNTVAAGQSAVFNGHAGFHNGDWVAFEKGTTISIKYTFFDERNPDEKYTFIVNYTYGTEGNEETTSALTFKYEGETVESGATIDIVSEISESLQIICDLEITNTTDNDINVVVNIVDSEIGSNDFCWGNCYMPGVYEASNTVAAGQSAVFNGHAGFHNGDWVAFEKGTTISIEYTFFDENNPEEKYVFTVNFKYESKESIVDYNSVDVFSNAYPNPANNTVSFDYNMPYNVNSASVAIYNMMGQEVVRQDLNLGGSRADINVSDLNEGVYFYSLIVNNQTVKTNKFVVSR